MTYEEFYDSLLPGNYSLTKSMELTKKTISGTLWYMKKFLVLYYYIFLSGRILTRDWVPEVRSIFESFVNSISTDQNVLNDARRFFFPASNTLNFQSSEFKYFTEFAPNVSFANDAGRNDYYNDAKRLYFVLLMDIGGQSGIKQTLFSYMQSSDFRYDPEDFKSKIYSAVAKEIYEQYSSSGCCNFTGDMKKVISDRAIAGLDQLASNGNIEYGNVVDTIQAFPKEHAKPNDIKNDLHSALRNERQILFYYGYCHSKTCTGNEFSSLTPIGEIAVRANYDEFCVIWEHQKLKMISQPPTVSIDNIPEDTNNRDKFGISYTPYSDILGYIKREKQITVNEFAYIVSRKKHIFEQEVWNWR